MQQSVYVRVMFVVMLFVISCLAPVGSADIMTYKGMGLRQMVYVHGDGVNRDVYTGELLIGYQGQDYSSYCVDIYQNVTTCEVTEMPVTSLQNGDMVAYLYENLAGQVDTSLEAASLQVAIWELVFEAEGNCLDVESGQFYITDNAAVALAAEEILASLPDCYSAAATTMVLHSGAFQDVLVPEPACLSLIVAGALLVIGRRRRRK